MKSKGVAYLLLIFLGVIGAHRFYIGKVGTGLIYLFTFGLFGVGVFIDLFTLGGQVDVYNAIYAYKTGANNVNSNTIIVNVDREKDK